MAEIVADPIDMETFCGAVHQWFSESTGLVTIWREQSSPAPELPYGSLSIIGPPTAVSPHWELRTETDLGRPSQEEVEMVSVVPCRIIVSCQAYVGRPESRAPWLNAMNYMNKAEAGLGLDSYWQRFNTKGISIWSRGPKQNINAILSGAFESRANMDVTFGASLSAVEYAGFIETAQVVSTQLGIDETVGVGV